MSETIDVKLERISRGNTCGHRSAACYTVRDEGTWQRLWQQTTSGRFPEPELPYVDFRSEMVLGAYLGERSSGGYTIEISDVQESPETLDVYIHKSEPGKGMVTSAMMTQPYDLVKVPSSNKPVVFTEYTGNVSS